MAALRNTLATRPQEGREDDPARQQVTRFRGKNDAEEVCQQKHSHWELWTQITQRIAWWKLGHRQKGAGQRPESQGGAPPRRL